MAGDRSSSISKAATPRTLAELVAAAERRGAEWLNREVWWRGAHYVLLVLASVLAAIAAATAVAQVWHGTLAGVLALTVSALTAAAAALRPALMAVGCGAKAARYLDVARDSRQADEEPGPDDAKRTKYYELLARYDGIRTAPEPALPSFAE
jgi:hypothetical protein